MADSLDEAEAAFRAVWGRPAEGLLSFKIADKKGSERGDSVDDPDHCCPNIN
jgi:hypothetical protein